MRDRDIAESMASQIRCTSCRNDTFDTRRIDNEKSGGVALVCKECHHYETR